MIALIDQVYPLGLPREQGVVGTGTVGGTYSMVKMSLIMYT